MALPAKQIYQQNSLESQVDTNNTYFVVDMLDPAGSGRYITYRLTCQQLQQILACSCMVTIKTVLTSAQILNLNTSPVVLVPAQGAGTIIQPFSFLCVKSNSTVAYATNTAIDFYVNGGQLAYAQDTTILPLTLSGISNNYSSSETASNGVLSIIENQSLLVNCPGGNPTGGNGTLTIYTSFTVITA